MAQYNMSFNSFQELLTFMKKKKCPYCINAKLERHFHKVFIGRKRGRRSNNLGQENYYQSTAIYTCTECERSYTLEGLLSGEPLESTDGLLTEGESKEIIKQRDREVTEINRSIVGKIFGLVFFFMLSMIIYEGVSTGDSAVILIFAPIILFCALISFLIFKYVGK